MKRAILKLAVFVFAVVAFSGAAVADTGGPDTYGYTWDDSITYDWVGIVETGVTIPLGDEGGAAVPLGFDFLFYGKTYNEVFVMSNGHLSFSGMTGFSVDCPFPTPMSPPGLVGYWEDLNPSSLGEIVYQTLGTSPNRVFVAEYWNVPVYGEDTNKITVEVLLFEATNDIVVQIRDISSTAGTQTAIGLVSPDQTDGLSAHCMTSGLANETAYLFKHPEGVWGSGSAMIGNAGDDVDHDVTLYNTMATGDFNFAVAGNSWTTAPDNADVNVVQGAMGANVISVTIPGGAVAWESDAATVTVSGPAVDETIDLDFTTLVNLSGNFAAIANMPAALEDNAIVASDDKIYSYSSNTGSATTDQLFAYDPVGNSWTTLTNSGTGTNCQDGVFLDGKLYFPGGYNRGSEAVSNALAIYDIAGNSWSAGAAMPGARWASAVVKYNDKIYVHGGSDGTTPYNTMYEYDPVGNTWASKASSLKTYYFHMAEVVNGKMYAIAGLANGADSNTIEVYDFAGDSWSDLVSSVPASTGWMGAGDSVYNDMIFLTNGIRDGVSGAYFSAFIPATNQWFDFTTTIFPTYGGYRLEADVLNGVLYQAGGFVGSWVATDLGTKFDLAGADDRNAASRAINESVIWFLGDFTLPIPGNAADDDDDDDDDNDTTPDDDDDDDNDTTADDDDDTTADDDDNDAADDDDNDAGGDDDDDDDDSGCGC